MFDKYFTSETAGFTTQSGVPFLRENLSDYGVKGPRGKFTGEWAKTRFHEGVHVQQARFSGNIFYRRLFGLGYFNYYKKRKKGYSSHPWEYGRYGAYTITNRWLFR